MIFVHSTKKQPPLRLKTVHDAKVNPVIRGHTEHLHHAKKDQL